MFKRIAKNIRAAIDRYRAKKNNKQRDAFLRLYCLHALCNEKIKKEQINKESIYRLYDQIRALPQIEKIRVQYKKNKFIVYTQPLFIDYDDKRYGIGSFKISIAFPKMEIRIQNRTNKRYCEKKYDFGIDRYHHPHIKNDIICFGNIGPTIYSLLRHYEFHAVLQIIVLFLESYCDDMPYYNIKNWDTVPKNEQLRMENK